MSSKEGLARRVAPSPKAAARPLDTHKLLSVLRAAKAQQDLTAQPTRGRGIWLNSHLWQAITRQLEQQDCDVSELERALKHKTQEIEELRLQADAERRASEKALADLRAQLVDAAAESEALRDEGRARQEAWAQHKKDLEAQADHLLGLLHDRHGLLADVEGLRGQLAAAQGAAAAAERRTAEAEARATELQRLHEYAMGKAEAGITQRDAQALRIRELSAALLDAREGADSLRRALAARSSPSEELLADLKRLRADNRRLVALLAGVPEYRALAAELAAEGGVHYMPLEEALMARQLVHDLHPQLLDRPVAEVLGGLAGAGRPRDPDAMDPSLTVVLDEQYNWVPAKALEVGGALLRRVAPALPMAQLYALVGEINKVWRDREKARLEAVAAAHREELKRLEHTFKQRAPYEAVVSGQKVNDLKRRIRAQAAQAQAAAATAKGERRRVEDDSRAMLHAGLSSIQDLSRQVGHLVTRNKKLASKAARQRQQAAARGPPVCSSCLDRLLLPSSNESTHYLGRALGVQHEDQSWAGSARAQAEQQQQQEEEQEQWQQWQEQQRQAEAVEHGAAATSAEEAASSGAAAAAAMASVLEAAAAAAKGAATASAASPLTSAAAATPTQAYHSTALGTLVRVNVTPPSPPAPQPSVWRQRELATATAAAAAAGGTPTRPAAPTAPQLWATPSPQRDAARLADIAAFAPSASGSVPVLHITSSGGGGGSSAGFVRVSGGCGAFGGGGPGVEICAGSFADWQGAGGGAAAAAAAAVGSTAVAGDASATGLSGSRGGGKALLSSAGGGSGPVVVEVKLPGGPAGGPVHGVLPVGSGSGSAAAAPGARTTPVRVALRFPRQDVA